MNIKNGNMEHSDVATLLQHISPSLTYLFFISHFICDTLVSSFAQHCITNDRKKQHIGTWYSSSLCFCSARVAAAPCTLLTIQCWKTKLTLAHSIVLTKFFFGTQIITIIENENEKLCSLWFDFEKNENNLWWRRTVLMTKGLVGRYEIWKTHGIHNFLCKHLTRIAESLKKLENIKIKKSTKK